MAVPDVFQPVKLPSLASSFAKRVTVAVIERAIFAVTASFVTTASI